MYNAAGRPRRTVQYRNPEEVWQYIGGGKRLAITPAQFNGLPGFHIHGSILRHSRKPRSSVDAESLHVTQELQMDAERQLRVQANVALIEARDREERAQVLRLQQEANTAKSIERPREVIGMHQQETQYSLKEQLPSETSPEHDKSPLPQMGTGADTYELEAWTPRTHARGG
ncbi:hypothetical protein C0995_003489 [Termitomyces sp. Mi166|nr:hypothetical protein C0995_003489 [Termitomyces sp. Mi166\